CIFTVLRQHHLETMSFKDARKKTAVEWIVVRDEDLVDRLFHIHSNSHRAFMEISCEFDLVSRTRRAKSSTSSASAITDSTHLGVGPSTIGRSASSRRQCPATLPPSLRVRSTRVFRVPAQSWRIPMSLDTRT